MKIANIYSVARKFGGPKPKRNGNSYSNSEAAMHAFSEAVGAALKAGAMPATGPDGRAYVPTARYHHDGRPNVSAATPRGMRWQGNKLIPRHSNRKTAH